MAERHVQMAFLKWKTVKMLLKRLYFPNMPSTTTSICTSAQQLLKFQAIKSKAAHLLLPHG